MLYSTRETNNGNADHLSRAKRGTPVSLAGWSEGTAKVVDAQTAL